MNLSSRRDFIRNSAGVAAGMLLAGESTAQAVTTGVAAGKRPVLRLAHITDVHLRPEHDAPKRFAEMLRHIRKTNPDIDLFLNGGDSIYAADYGNIKRDRVETQWNIWQEVIAAELKDVKIYGCLGNHDMWWAGPKDDAMYGKPWVVKQLGIPDRYYSFTRDGWHFCVLDSNNDGGALDKAQRAWLEKQIAANRDKPVLLLSHYPIAAYCTTIDGGLHRDSKSLVALFAKNPNVKVCLSGHIHLLDRVWYNGVKYFCNGSASGYWWEPGPDGKSTYQETPPGYAIVELYADGEAHCEYFPFPARRHAPNAF